VNSSEPAAPGLGAQLRRRALDPGPLATLLRYGLVGGSMSLLYAVIVPVLIEVISAPPWAASLAASAIVTPPTFLGQKLFTFRATGVVKRQFASFSALVLLVMLLGAGMVTLLIDGFGLPAGVASVSTAVAMPLVSYALQKYWVFAAKL
jgi:putative flippase GtrA